MIPKVLICGADYMGMKCAEVSMLEEGQVWGEAGKKTEYEVSFRKILLKPPTEVSSRQLASWVELGRGVTWNRILEDSYISVEIEALEVGEMAQGKNIT